MKQSTEKDKNEGINPQVYHHRESHNHKIFFVCFLLLIHLANGVRPVCVIEDVDSLGSSTTITCYFPETVEQSDFRVIHLSSNDSVVSAKWDQDQYMYSLGDGFSMEGQKSMCQITFKIDQVNSTHAGEYACVPDGSSYENVRTCTLSLKSEGRQLSTDRTSMMKSSYEADAEINRTNYLAALTASVILALLLVTVVVIWGVQIARQKRQQKQDINVRSVPNSVAAEKSPLMKRVRNLMTGLRNKA